MLKLYDFECKKCKIIKEYLIEVNDIIKCPICGKDMKKLMGGPPFHLKGSGWSSDNYGLKKGN